MDQINEDALAWAETWNHHKLQIRGERQQTPQEMYFFSMVEDGARGLNGQYQNGGHVDGLQEGEDVSQHGIDWEAMNDVALMTHHHQYNPTLLDNPFSAGPSTLSEVECTPPDCPISAQSVHQLDHHLSQTVDINSRNMLVRRAMWVEALHFCSQTS